MLRHGAHKYKIFETDMVLYALYYIRFGFKWNWKHTIKWNLQEVKKNPDYDFFKQAWVYNREYLLYLVNQTRETHKFKNKRKVWLRKSNKKLSGFFRYFNSLSALAGAADEWWSADSDDDEDDYDADLKDGEFNKNVEALQYVYDSSTSLRRHYAWTKFYFRTQYLYYIGIDKVPIINEFDSWYTQLKFFKAKKNYYHKICSRYFFSKFFKASFKKIYNFQKNLKCSPNSFLRIFKIGCVSPFYILQAFNWCDSNKKIYKNLVSRRSFEIINSSKLYLFYKYGKKFSIYKKNRFPIRIRTFLLNDILCFLKLRIPVYTTDRDYLWLKNRYIWRTVTVYKKTKPAQYYNNYRSWRFRLNRFRPKLKRWVKKGKYWVSEYKEKYWPRIFQKRMPNTTKNTWWKWWHKVFRTTEFVQSSIEESDVDDEYEEDADEIADKRAKRKKHFRVGSKRQRHKKLKWMWFYHDDLKEDIKWKWLFYVEKYLIERNKQFFITKKNKNLFFRKISFFNIILIFKRQFFNFYFKFNNFLWLFTIFLFLIWYRLVLYIFYKQFFFKSNLLLNQNFNFFFIFLNKFNINKICKKILFFYIKKFNKLNLFKKKIIKFIKKFINKYKIKFNIRPCIKFSTKVIMKANYKFFKNSSNLDNKFNNNFLKFKKIK